jgi:hypothetical protein
MFDTKKILIVTFAALGLTACGKDNYNGQYTGSEVKIPQSGQTGQTGGSQYGYGYSMYGTQYSAVTANLSHNGDVVTGQYEAQNSMYGGGTYNQYPSSTGTTGTGQMYRFEATAKQANRLEGVRLIPLNSYSGGCILEGSLEAVDDGARITGTLNPANVGYQSGMYFCLPTQITLDRVGGK